MKLVATLRGIAATALVAVALPGHAQQCDVFTDVLATDSFCDSVQWLKNRQITLGCTATQYCPSSNVTRAQMALFMNRLGRALASQEITATGSFAAPPALNPNQFVPICVSSNIAPATYPRLARLRGYVSAPASGSTAMTMFMVFDGAPPGPWQNANSVSLTVPNPTGHHNLAWASNVFSVPVNTTMRFAIGLANAASATGTLTIGAGTCVLDVTIVNDNPTSPPFDE